METALTTTATLELNPQNREHLKTTAKWAKFLAILGFICCGFVVLLGLFFSAIMSFLKSATLSSVTPMPGFFGTFMAIIYLALAAVYFFPCLYLYRFADKMQMALTGNQQVDFDFSISNLKSLFKFMGIVTIIGLCIFALEIVVLILLGVSGVFSGAPVGARV